jgi:hypothetical protein
MRARNHSPTPHVVTDRTNLDRIAGNWETMRLFGEISRYHSLARTGQFSMSAHGCYRQLSANSKR